MSASAPDIPLPADVDVSDMPHLPLFDARLMRSRAWLRAKNWRGEGPGLAFALINLWTAAFRAVPAGSLEDDDEMLAEHANCDIAHWLAMKERALAGWFPSGGRMHHPVVGQIALDLWLVRIVKRYENSVLSWRAACKRATDKGIAPPDPPGAYGAWLVRTYPDTASWLSEHRPDVVVAMTVVPARTVCHADKSENHSDKTPKRSKGNISPLNPPAAADRPGAEKGLERDRTGKTGEGKRWFAVEIGRLTRSFGAMKPMMVAHLQKPGTSGDFVFVQVFKGAWLDPGGASRPAAIVMPSKRRADALKAEHGDWIAVCWPRLAIRHATVAELRAFKESTAA